MAIFSDNKKYILSKNIKVFPTNFRGTYDSNTANLINTVTVKTYGFDPEAKLTTEKNLISLPGNSFGNDSYIIDYVKPASTEPPRYTLRFVLGGYYFEIFDSSDFLADLNGKCLNIKTETVDIQKRIDTTESDQSLFTTGELYDNTRQTTQLSSWESSENLDEHDDKASYFTGILVSDAKDTNATAYLENIVINNSDTSEINKNLCRANILSGQGENSIRLTHATGSRATGNNSLATGYNTEASGRNSAAFGSSTIANQPNQFVIGKANVKSNSLFIIGDGEVSVADNVGTESVVSTKNIFEVNSTETKVSPKFSVVSEASLEKPEVYFTTDANNTNISSNKVNIKGKASTTISGNKSELILSSGTASITSNQINLGRKATFTDSTISFTPTNEVSISTASINLTTTNGKSFKLNSNIAELSSNTNINLIGNTIINGNTTINGTTTISSTTTLRSDLIVSGPTTLSNTLKVTDNITTGSSLYVNSGNLYLGGTSANIYINSSTPVKFLEVTDSSITLSKNNDKLTISSNTIGLSTSTSSLALTDKKLTSTVPFDGKLNKTLSGTSLTAEDFIVASEGNNKFKLSIGVQNYSKIIRTQTGTNKTYSTKEIADLFALNSEQIKSTLGNINTFNPKNNINKGPVIGLQGITSDKPLFGDSISDLKNLSTIATSTLSCFQNAFITENPSLDADKYNMFIFKSKNKTNTKQFIAINANGNTVADSLIVNTDLAIGPADSSGKYKVVINTDQSGNVNFEAENLKIGKTTISKTAIVVEDGTIEASSFNATSDARLKENLVPYSAKKSILDLPVYKYNFIGKEGIEIGCLAQDLEKICPELVSKNENGYLSIKETKLIYLLLDEVKKLKKELEEIKNK